MTVDRRISDAFEAETGFSLESLIVLALMGSHSHGTYIPPDQPDAIDDIDLMGIVVPPLPFHIGLPRWEHWRFQSDELDVVVYSLEKAVRMLLKNNPNIVGLLWLRDADLSTWTGHSRCYETAVRSSRPKSRLTRLRGTRMGN